MKNDFKLETSNYLEQILDIKCDFNNKRKNKVVKMDRPEIPTNKSPIS